MENGLGEAFYPPLKTIVLYEGYTNNAIATISTKSTHC